MQIKYRSYSVYIYGEHSLVNAQNKLHGIKNEVIGGDRANQRVLLCVRGHELGRFFTSADLRREQALEGFANCRIKTTQITLFRSCQNRFFYQKITIHGFVNIQNIRMEQNRQEFCSFCAECRRISTLNVPQNKQPFSSQSQN